MSIERGKCPKCEARLKEVNVEYVDVIGAGANYKGVSYVCPHCSAVLSVAIDPLFVKNQIVVDVLKALGRG